jgi:hypothetical protein
VNPPQNSNPNQLQPGTQMVSSSVNNYQPPNTNSQSAPYQNYQSTGPQIPPSSINQNNAIDPQNKIPTSSINQNNTLDPRVGNNSMNPSNPVLSQSNQGGTVINYAQ